MSPTIYYIVSAQLKNSVLSGKGRRWTAFDKAFALNVLMVSPSTYRLLKKFLCLPSITTLHRSIQWICNTSGFCEKIFYLLQRKLKTQNENQKLCVLSVDEMAIRPRLQYLNKYDHIIGYQDSISLREDGIFHIATHALVFMARGVMNNWKQILGYFFVYHCIPGSMLKTLVVECIKRLQNADLKVVALVCDQGSNNMKMFSELQLSEHKTSFNVNDETVYFFFDPPHLLKSVRNNMMRYDIHFSEKIAKWKYICDFFNIDSKNTLRTARKLTVNHICPVGRNKMKVKYASQVLSNSVAAGICLLTSINAFPGEAAHTADFLSKCDMLFDSFNSCSLYSRKKMCCAVKKDSPHLEFWEEMLLFVKTWTFVDKNGKIISTHCKKGWQVTLRSAIDMSRHLLKQHDFLLMKRFNQDALENTFSFIRAKRGNDSNPDCSQFNSCIKAILLNNVFSASNSSNCE